MSIERQSSRLPGLDGLRGISILLVLMLHSVWYKHLHLSDQTAEYLNQVTYPLGTFGVPIFFVISGFLITYLLLREEAKNGHICLKNFWLRRFFRIVPPVALYVAIVVCYSLPVGSGLDLKDLTAVLLFFRNLVSGGGMTDHFWSLSLEEQFYLLWPLLLFLAPRRWRLGAAVFLLLLFPVARIISVLFLEPARHDFVMRLIRFDFIMAGCLLALFWQASGYAGLNRAVGNMLFVGGIVSIIAAWWLAYQYQLFPCSGDPRTLTDVILQEAITGLLGIGICAVMITLVTNSTVFGVLVNFSPLSGIGVISYSLYLWQQFFFFAPKLPHFMMYLPVRFCFAFGVAACGYYFIEKPFATIRQRIRH